MQVIASLLANFERSKGAKSNSINLAFWSVAGIYPSQMKNVGARPNRPYTLCHAKACIIDSFICQNCMVVRVVSLRQQHLYQRWILLCS